MTYFIHINAEGEELRFDTKPMHLPVLEVRPDGKTREVTRTHIVYHAEDTCAHNAIMVKPRGEGWVYHDIEDERFAVWRRKVARGASSL
jgi:hypothetical protein